MCLRVLMTNVKSATLCIRLETETKKMLAEIRQADREVASGHYIMHEDMRAWLLSWRPS